MKNTKTLLAIGEVVKLPPAPGGDVDIDLALLRRVDLSSIPEELHVSVTDSRGLSFSIRRDEDMLFVEQLYVQDLYDDTLSRPAHLLVVSRAIAAKILENEDCPIFEAAYDEIVANRPAASWFMAFPTTITPQEMIEAIRDCERAVEKKAKEIMPE